MSHAGVAAATAGREEVSQWISPADTSIDVGAHELVSDADGGAVVQSRVDIRGGRAWQLAEPTATMRWDASFMNVRLSRGLPSVTRIEGSDNHSSRTPYSLPMSSLEAAGLSR